MDESDIHISITFITALYPASLCFNNALLFVIIIMYFGLYRNVWTNILIKCGEGSFSQENPLSGLNSTSETKFNSQCDH